MTHPSPATKEIVKTHFVDSLHGATFGGTRPGTQSSHTAQRYRNESDPEYNGPKKQRGTLILLTMSTRRPPPIIKGPGMSSPKNADLD